MVAIFSDHLEAFLASEWPEWITSCAAVEATSGISINKNPIAYRIATSQAEGSIPEMLTQILNKVNDL